jgi:predicted MarR family transcription regulator
MRITTIAIGSALAACLAAPTVGMAQTNRTFASCDALAGQRGVTEFERRSTDSPSPYRQFMVRCLAGQISGATTGAATQPMTRAATRIASKWDACDTLAGQRGVAEFERRSTDSPSPYRQFMVRCLAGQVH